MTMLARRMRNTARGDRGVAMITTLLVGAVLAALGVAVVDVSVASLKSAGRDRVAGGALGAAEAGIAQGIDHVRSTGVGGLAPGAPWGDAANAVDFDLSDGRSASVWIEVIQPFAPPLVKVGTYKIHSTGTVGNGPGLRSLEQTITARPFEFPIGVFAHQIALNGTPNTFQENVFSTGCISGRDKMIFEGIDPYYGIPASAHSVKWISTKNGSCAANESRNIHRTSVCNPLYPYDQDALGGNLNGTSCDGSGTTYPQTSGFTQADLDATYGKALTEGQLASLRAKAQSQGNFWTSATGWTPPNPAVHPNAVLYFKIGPNATVTLQNELNGYTYDQTCVNPPRSLIIVVDNGSVGSGGVHLNSNNDLFGALFVQKGNFQYNGTATWTGTVYANTLDKWNGNAEARLDSCFLTNLPGGLLNVSLTRFREVDR